MDHDIEQPNGSAVPTPPGDPAPELPAPALRGRGALVLLAAGAAVGGAVLTMAILGRTAPPPAGARAAATGRDPAPVASKP
jgi:hypothetical protein